MCLNSHIEWCAPLRPRRTITTSLCTHLPLLKMENLINEENLNDSELIAQFHQLIEALQSENDFLMGERICLKVTATPVLSRIVSGRDKSLLIACISTSSLWFLGPAIKLLIDKNPSSLLWGVPVIPGFRTRHPIHFVARELSVLMPSIAEAHAWVLDHDSAQES